MRARAVAGIALALCSGAALWGVRLALVPGRRTAPGHARAGGDRAPLEVGEARGPGAAEAAGPTCRLTGVVLDQDELPLSGLELELRACPRALERSCWGAGLAALSGPADFAPLAGGRDGSFAFDAVPPGGWALCVRGPADVPRAAYLFRVGPEQRARHMCLVLPRGLRLRGRVLDPTGAFCGGIRLDAAGLDTTFEAGTSSASDGRFVLGPLLPGRYLLEAIGPESTTSPTRIVWADEEDSLELRLEPAAVLRVCVRDPTGAPVTARLELFGASSRRAAGSELLLAHLVPGSYELVAQADDGRLTVVQGLWLEAGLAPQPLEVVLQRACRLRLRLAGEDRRAWRAAWNGTPVDHGVLEPGTEACALLPPGPVAVWWSRLADGEETIEHVDERVLVAGAEAVVIEYAAR